ncbi:nitroreductase family protein [archaeon]|nr:nitroreductase family protein [archaeon]
MRFNELAQQRRSIHHFTDEPVTDEELETVLEAARWAPSAGNAQPTRFLVISDELNREMVWESTTGIEGVTPQNFIKKAPVHIIVLADTRAYKGKQSSLFMERFLFQDTSAATMNLLLAVSDTGLGACWVGMFRDEALRESFNIPTTLKPVAIIPVGHTESKEKPRPRKPLTELVYHESLSG